MSTSCSGFGAGRRHVMFKKRAYLRIVEISNDNPHHDCPSCSQDPRQYLASAQNLADRPLRPLLALSGHPLSPTECPLFGVKRACRLYCKMSASDPKWTLPV